ncbi:MAG: MAPEG family protein [Rhodospirillaceae bacterium]|nr:MAPEG family protein [Rhodospirillaceae bacterium]
MLDAFPYSAIVTALALLVYVWVTLKVGGARAKFGVKAPSIDGPPDFQRVFRVQQNTVEQIVLFLPALWLFAAAWGDMWAGIIGIFWPVGRILYAVTYYEAAEKRSAGFGLTFLPSVILLLGGLAGAVMKVL